jgi:hypothetical protein
MEVSIGFTVETTVELRESEVVKLDFRKLNRLRLLKARSLAARLTHEGRVLEGAELAGERVIVEKIDCADESAYDRSWRVGRTRPCDGQSLEVAECSHPCQGVSPTCPVDGRTPGVRLTCSCVEQSPEGIGSRLLEGTSSADPAEYKTDVRGTEAVCWKGPHPLILRNTKRT